MDEAERKRLIAILVSAGWRWGYSRWRNCRQCRAQINDYEMVTLYSPAYTAYHPDCALQSKQAQRTIDRAGRNEQ